MILLMFFDSNKFVVFLFSWNAPHVFIEVIVNVLWTITRTKCFLKKFMVILLLYFFFEKITLWAILKCLLPLFGKRAVCSGFLSIWKVHFMKTLLLFFLFRLLLPPKNLITFLIAICNFLVFDDLSILFNFFGQQLRKDISFDINLIGIR